MHKLLQGLAERISRFRPDAGLGITFGCRNPQPESSWWWGDGFRCATPRSNFSIGGDQQRKHRDVERPIILAAHEVRGILDGRQTQLRRVIKQQPNTSERLHFNPHHSGFSADCLFPRQSSEIGKIIDISCPFGRIGDRLWVKESWRAPKEQDDRSVSCFARLSKQAGYDVPWVPTQFEADGKRLEWEEENIWGAEAGRLRPPSQMLRWASRILLEIVSVRVERLQDISRVDAAAEGVCLRDEEKPWPVWCRPDKWPEENFMRLWDSLNGEMSHMANPYIWVVEFKRVTADE